MKYKSANQLGNFIPLFDDLFLANQRIAGKCVQTCLEKVENLLKSQNNLSTKDLEICCEPIFSKFNCIPTFFNYQPKGMRPFPGKVCVSVNNELVHGIPGNRRLQDGDVVKVDLGATYEGAIADAARSFIFGEPKKQEHVDMLSVCSRSLEEAVKNIKIGSKTGSIGFIINKIIKSSPFRVINDYGGHGISYNFETKQGIPHAYPFIHNKAQINEGVTIQPGMTFAIEPLVVKGDNRTRIASDGWTVLVDSEVSAHYEHTIFITEAGPEIIA